MATKTHCDNCDSMLADSHFESIVEIGITSLVSHFKLLVQVEKQYTDGIMRIPQDLCVSCKRRAVTRLLDQLGGELR